MATIRKQSIVSSLFIYAGFVIGAINVLVLFPRYFTPAQFGLTRILVDIAMILAALGTAALVPVGFKFFPFYKHYLPKQKNDHFTLLLSLFLISQVILIILYPWIKPWIIRKFSVRSPILTENLDLVLPLTFFMGMFTLFETFAWNIGKQIIANLTKELLFRSIVMILILLWIAGWITSFDQFIGIYAFSYLPLALLLGLVIVASKKYHITFSFSKLTKRMAPLMARFGGAYFLSALLNVVAKTNDTIIIASQSIGGLADAAIFTIATYLVTVMEVPQRSVISAATPQIAQAWKDHDMAKLDRLYKKTALNLLIVACGILGIIFLSTPLLLEFLGQPYKAVPMLLLILGLSKLIDLGTGMNSQILQLSKHWRIDLFTNILFVAVSIVLNYTLTKRYGINGTAIGSLTSIIAFNGIRYIYIKNIYKLQPFSSKNFLTLLIATTVTLALYFIDFGMGIWLESIIKCIVFALIFGGFIFGFNISPDLTELFKIIRLRLISREK